MRAIIEVEVLDYQIGQEVSIYFKDTMMIKGIVQEPKAGHWINCKCDQCGAPMNYCYENCGDIKKTILNYSNYCPNCGARMESENDNT